MTPGTQEVAPSQSVTTAAAPLSSTSTPAPNQSIPIPTAPIYWTLHDWLLILVCGSLWLGIVFAAIWMPTGSYQSWRHVTLACCFAPLGAILRWYLARWNGMGLKRFEFPIGTFVANIVGTMILAAVICLQHSTAIQEREGAAVACQIFSGLQDGFCGTCFFV